MSIVHHINVWIGVCYYLNFCVFTLNLVEENGFDSRHICVPIGVAEAVRNQSRSCLRIRGRKSRIPWIHSIINIMRVEECLLFFSLTDMSNERRQCRYGDRLCLNVRRWPFPEGAVPFGFVHLWILVTLRPSVLKAVIRSEWELFGEESA